MPWMHYYFLYQIFSPSPLLDHLLSSFSLICQNFNKNFSYFLYGWWLYYEYFKSYNWDYLGGVSANYYLSQNCPGWCGSVDWVLACDSRGCQFNSQLGHMPGLQARSPVGMACERQPHIGVSLPLSPSLLLSLKINKILKKNSTVFFTYNFLSFSLSFPPSISWLLLTCFFWGRRFGTSDKGDVPLLCVCVAGETAQAAEWLPCP